MGSAREPGHSPGGTLHRSSASSASFEALALRRALLAACAAEPRWPDFAKRFALALAASLEGPLPAGPEGGAALASAALASARAGERPGERAAPGASGAEVGEACAGLVLALAGRDAMRGVGGARGDRDERFDALADLVAELAAALGGALPSRRAPLSSEEEAGALGAARRALSAAKRGAAVGYAAAAFVASCFDGIAEALPRLTASPAGGGSEAEALRRAVLEAEATASRRSPASVAAAPAWARRALVRQVLVESAGALADAAAPSLPGREGANGETGFLARAACLALAGMAEVEVWFPEPAPAPPRRARGHERENAPGNTAGNERGNAPGNERCARNARHRDDEPARQEDATMKDTTQTILKTLHHDATDAAWRTAGSHFVKLTRDPLAAALSRHLGPGDAALRGRIAGFLETEVGTVLLTSLLSMALSALPHSAGEVPARLARELRVKAMADASDLVAEVLMGPLREVMALHLSGGALAGLAAARAPSGDAELRPAERGA